MCSNVVFWFIRQICRFKILTPATTFLQRNSSQKDWSKLDLIASVRRSKEEYLRKLNLARVVQKSAETKQKQNEKWNDLNTNTENIVIHNNHKNKDYVSHVITKARLTFDVNSFLKFYCRRGKSPFPPLSWLLQEYSSLAERMTGLTGKSPSQFMRLPGDAPPQFGEILSHVSARKVPGVVRL